MTRSAYDVACSGRDDLYGVQDAFNNLRAIFTLMRQHFPEDHTAHAFAQLGILEVNDWSTKVLQWAECMDHELIDLKVGGVQ
jgi:hypothetical protein